MLIFRRTIVLTQHLVSSICLGDCSVHRLREDSRNLCTVTIPDAVLIQLSSWRWAQWCSKHVEECNKCIKKKNLCIKMVNKTAIIFTICFIIIRIFTLRTSSIWMPLPALLPLTNIHILSPPLIRLHITLQLHMLFSASSHWKFKKYPHYLLQRIRKIWKVATLLRGPYYLSGDDHDRKFITKR